MRKGLTAEDVAASILESLGYSILEKRKQVVVGGVKIAEIDLVAKDPDGNVFAVEVKSGKASVTDVRQVYSNSKLINAKPLLICRGFSDSSAISLASEFDVRYLLLPEYYLFTLEDFKEIAKELIHEILTLYFSLKIEKVTEDDERIIEAISASRGFCEAADRLSISEEELGKRISELGFFRFSEGDSFQYLRLQALLILNRINQEKRFEKIYDKINSLEKKIDDLGKRIHQIG
ncbi:MAG: YraN family protein [Thermoproteota archaeon]|nr:YraN family protein [Candidatus Brockarchaeota archaeon]